MKSTVKVMQTLRARLLVSMVLLITASLALMTALNSMMNTKALDEQATDYSRQMLEQIQINVNSIVSKAQNIMQYLSEDQNVLAYLRLDNFYDENRIELETKSRDAMRVYVNKGADRRHSGAGMACTPPGAVPHLPKLLTRKSGIGRWKCGKIFFQSPLAAISAIKTSAMDVVSMVRAVVEPDTRGVGRDLYGFEALQHRGIHSRHHPGKNDMSF